MLIFFFNLNALKLHFLFLLFNNVTLQQVPSEDSNRQHTYENGVLVIEIFKIQTFVL